MNVKRQGEGSLVSITTIYNLQAEMLVNFANNLD